MASIAGLALVLLPWGLAACASSFDAGRSRVAEQYALLQDAHGEAADFKSLTFYRLSGLGGLHAYLGARFVHVSRDAAECAHAFTLGLSTERDLHEFERRIGAGTVDEDASGSFLFTNHAAAVDALRGVVSINDATMYRQHAATFYLGLLLTPLLGRPCANVVDDMERFLSTHVNRESPRPRHDPRIGS